MNTGRPGPLPEHGPRMSRNDRRGKVLVVALVGAGLALALFAAWYIRATWGR